MRLSFILQVLKRKYFGIEISTKSYRTIQVRVTKKYQYYFKSAISLK